MRKKESFVDLSNIQGFKFIVKKLNEGVLFPKGASKFNTKISIDSVVIDSLSAQISSVVKTYIDYIIILSDSLIPSCMDGLGIDSYIDFITNRSPMRIPFMCEEYKIGWLNDLKTRTIYKVFFPEYGEKIITKSIQEIREKME